jgi:hypothetical protein
MADNTASLVVALSAQLTKFEQDMKKAGIMADQATNDIERKFSSMNPKISTSFFGNLFSNLATKALDAAESAIAKLIDRFADLQKTAEYAGTSMQWLYGVQAAGAKAGASIEDINTAVRALAFQLDEMQRGGDNALKKLFDANPQFLKGVNRDALDVAGTLRIVGNIIEQLPNQVQKVDVAKNLGMPEGAVAAFRQGGEALENMAKQASAAAPNIDQAAEATRKLTAAWKEYIKDLGSDWADKALVGFKKLAEVALAITEWEQSLFHGGPLEAASGRELERWREINRILNETKKPTEGLTRVPISKGGTATDPFARKTAATDTASAYERETNAINKQIAVMQAENATLGESAHAQEEYRVQLVLSEKAAQDGKEFTKALNDEIAVTAERAATAKQALAEHTFAMNRLNSASQQVGSALSTAFADAIVDGKSLTEVMSGLVKTLEKAAINATVMSFFTPGPGASLSPFASLFKFAGGTDFAPGGWSVVGEQGPEVVNLPRGAQVIPNNVARNIGGGDSIQNVFNVAGDVSQSTIDRLRDAVVSAHRKADGLARVVTSTRRLQATGVA